jgi:hypothetical protein
MKKLLLGCILAFSPLLSNAQTFCDPNGNLIIYSNYDGGILNIDVDVNIPNLKIGVVSYEAIQVNITGAFAANVTEVHYAGYNDANDGCSQGVATTVINSTGSTNTIVFAPPVTLSNTNGYSSIICAAYNCNTNTNQGGCNTSDQIEDYFLNYFSGSVLRSHSLQYNCFATTQLVSAGGTCCGLVTNLTAQATATQLSCYGDCNATATASAIGGTPPYSYQWQGGPAAATWPNRCAGTYLVTVTDANSNTDTQSVTIVNPAQVITTISDTVCGSLVFNGNTITQSGIYYDTLAATDGCDSFITLNLTVGTGPNVSTSLSGGTLTSAQANAQYQWVKCPNYTPVAGATAQSYTPAQSGSYAVIVSYLACTDTSNCTNVIPAGIGHNSIAGEFNVYPNPAKTEVYIESPVDADYRLTDQTGRVVMRGRHNAGTSMISLKEFSAGLYFLYIADTQPVKLLKQ